MESVGTFEAKTYLTRLLEAWLGGERIVITNRGKAVAMLVLPEAVGRADTAEVGLAMLAYRDRVPRRLGGSFRELAAPGPTVLTAR